ncbi:MAG: aminotransferase class I/II-fold pyridoxal phosphate-dependent enzyme [Actinomycetota bacterium]
MVRGWADHAGGRHHGAHGGVVARDLEMPPGGFLDFSQNINPFGAPEGALEAAVRAIGEESARYPDLDYAELREALGGYLGIPAGRILPTNGGAEALFLAARAVSRGGAGVVLEPTFSEYAAAIGAAGMKPLRRIVRRAENGFRFDPGSLGELKGVDAVFLCNPNNPTGDALSRAEVLELAHRVRAAGAALVVDEAFADFAPEASVVDLTGEGLFVARSLTKFFAIPGLRLGCLVCADMESVQRFQPSWSVNVAAAAAGITAARDRSFSERSVSGVARLRAELFAALERLPHVQPFPGAANFLLARAPEGVVGRLAARGVLVRGCGPFVGLGEGYLRVAVRGTEDNRRLVSAIREAL